MDGRLQGMEARITEEIRGMKSMFMEAMAASQAAREGRTNTPGSVFESPVSATFPPLPGSANSVGPSVPGTPGVC